MTSAREVTNSRSVSVYLQMDTVPDRVQFLEAEWGSGSQPLSPPQPHSLMQDKVYTPAWQPCLSPPFHSEEKPLSCPFREKQGEGGGNPKDLVFPQRD